MKRRYNLIREKTLRAWNFSLYSQPISRPGKDWIRLRKNRQM